MSNIRAKIPKGRTMLMLPQYNIAIKGEGLNKAQADYEYETHGVITEIEKRATGRAVLNGIKKSGSPEWVLISPYGPAQKAKTKECNSSVKRRKVPIVYQNLWACCTIHFSRGTFSGACAMDPGSLADEMLMHELVHAQREAAGVFHPAWFTAKEASLRPFDDEEEFLAVTVTNVYISESGLGQLFFPIPFLTRLRADHANTRLPILSLTSTLMNDPGYYRLVKQYCDELPQIAGPLSRVDAMFNPFRVYYEWKAKNYQPKP